MKANTSIDEMLFQDNGAGFVELNGSKVIDFAGRKRSPQHRIGPVRRKSVIDGQIFQIGGRDETINVHLRNAHKPSETYRSEVSIDLARKLMPHFLLGRVRLFGEGDWYRTDSGWVMSPNSFTAHDFALIDESNLSRTITSARQIFCGREGGRRIAGAIETRLIVFDTTALSFLFIPDYMPSTPVRHGKERLDELVEAMTANQDKIGIPSPALSEFLVTCNEKQTDEFLKTVRSSAWLEILDFDTPSAVEVAVRTRRAIEAGDKREGLTIRL